MKKVLARHKWLFGCVILEMLDTETDSRYFVATVLGWHGFYLPYLPTETILSEVRGIMARIEAGDEEVFKDKKYYKKTVYEGLGVK